MTCNYNVAKITPQNMKRITKYTQYARNIKDIIDPTDLRPSTHIGPKEIMRVFMDLPPVTYDMLSFCTDCTVFNVSEEHFYSLFRKENFLTY